MLGLPKSTEYGRRIPKNKFYEHLSVSAKLKRLFIDQIENITWSNKIAPETVNIARGERVHEIEVITIRLTQPEFDRKILQLIDKGIPYHLLFVMEHEGRIQLWLGYKEQYEANNAGFRILEYYNTEWRLPNDVLLPLAGLNLDSVYDNLVKYIAGDELEVKHSGDVKNAIGRAQAIEKLRKLIAALESKRNKEKQLNKQIDINSEIKALKRQLEDLM